MNECKFEIKCLSCESTDVSVLQEIDYDYEESPYYTGCYYLKCNSCGQQGDEY